MECPACPYIWGQEGAFVQLLGVIRMVLDSLYGSDLEFGQIHVWYIKLNGAGQICDRNDHWLTQFLSQEELEKSRRFVRKSDRTRYAMSHIALRMILAHYLSLAPAAIRFTCNSFGKPSLLAFEEGSHPINFNLSHSGSYAIVAISRQGQLGVDIEKICAHHDIELLVNTYFSLTERQMFRLLPEDVHMLEFFRIWTRKEAFIKALGMGFSFPLSDFDVTVMPDVMPGILHISDSSYDVTNWSVFNLKPKNPYVGSLVSWGEYMDVRHIYTSINKIMGVPIKKVFV